MTVIKETGHVLGVDVGFSSKNRSSAVCRLSWSSEAITWEIDRYRATEVERVASISKVARDAHLTATAFDGPLRSDLEIIGRYRSAERMLTRRFAQMIGKPGQSNAPVGKNLNAAANNVAKLVLKLCSVGPARHDFAIHEAAIYEAFPSSFLGVLMATWTDVTAKRGDRSDLFFQHTAKTGMLVRLLGHLLPQRRIPQELDLVTNHDDRAALICATTALCVAAGDFTAVGDEDGWIVLPPARFIARWAMDALEANAADGFGNLKIVNGLG